MNAFRSEAEDRAVGLLETFLPQKIVELGRVLEAPEFNVKGTSAFDPGELPILTTKVSKKPKCDRMRLKTQNIEQSSTIS